MPYVNNKGADQPAHLRSLISTFVVRCLDSIILLVYISEISSLYLASVAEQAGLSLSWSQTPKTDFLVTGLNYIFRFLRVSTVQELPPKFAPPKPVSHHHGMKMEVESILPSSNVENSPTHIHQRVIEDTAATPPTYKYEKAKEISLEESLSLQKSQKEKQDVSLGQP